MDWCHMSLASVIPPCLGAGDKRFIYAWNECWFGITSPRCNVVHAGMTRFHKRSRNFKHTNHTLHILGKNHHRTESSYNVWVCRIQLHCNFANQFPLPPFCLELLMWVRSEQIHKEATDFSSWKHKDRFYSQEHPVEVCCGRLYREIQGCCERCSIFPSKNCHRS